MTSGIEVVGLKGLIDKMEELGNENLAKRLQKQAIEPVAKQVLDEMKSVTPVSTRRNIHGITAENLFQFSYNGGGGYKVGITNQGGHGDAYWELIRGVWFQNFKTDEPNFGWYTKFKEANMDKWKQECRESCKKALAEYLNSL